MNTFIFRDIESDEFGVIVENPSKVPVSQPRVETQKVIGSPKLLHFVEGPLALDPVTIQLDCALLNPDDQRITEVCEWLRGGGELVIPADPEHCYRAWVKGQIDLQKVIRARPDRRFTVQFECEGFRYQYPAPSPIVRTVGFTIRNPGTAPSEPLIEVTGSGDISLMVGASTLLIDGLDGSCTIDCEAQLVYDGDTNLGASVTRLGDWPTIAVGGTAINWSGDVTQVTVWPRWRDY